MVSFLKCVITFFFKEKRRIKQCVTSYIYGSQLKLDLTAISACVLQFSPVI